jgi:uncharacterized membrane protein YraQ (UPF0718 family)
MAIAPHELRAEAPRAARHFDFRIAITGALIAGLCGMFWVGSRYPSLQGKASADPNEALSTPLGFERFFPEPPAEHRVKHIGWTAMEWGMTNRQGMIFGLLLAAGMITIVPLVRGARGGRFAGAVQGMIIGTPLGVCVNCAAPITQGMLRAGSRVEVALSTLFSSPTFNVIVLGIVVSIFPWYLATLKILSGLLMVLVVAPWLARLAERPGWRRPMRPPPRLPGLGLFQRLEAMLGTPSLDDTAASPTPKGFFRSLGWVLLHYPRNLWRVALVALPLMLLAGILGAVLAELLPWNYLTHLARIEGWFPNAGVLLLAAAFGVLLPVPMAFDVIVCSVLLNSGMPVHVVATLLVTLGIYSVYPWTLLGTTLSWRIAALAGAAVFAVGLASGAAAGVLDRWHEIDQERQTAQLARLAAAKPQRPLLPAGAGPHELRRMARHLPPPQQVATQGDLELWYAPFEGAGVRRAEKPFTRIDGSHVGFKRLPLPRPYQAMQPGPMHLGPLAADDVNDDGWPDVAVGTAFGVFLYVNVGSRFAVQEIDFPRMREWLICDVALVDLDGDGARDLFFSTWAGGSHVLFNRFGGFSERAHVELPGAGETCVASSAFADVDRDGDLDLVTGGASFQSWFFNPAPAVNRLWRNEGGRFEPETLPGPEGDTLSLLVADLNDDGWPDLLVGNDFDEPDRVFLNESGRLRPLKGRESPIPYSTTTTMSFDTGDLDNDGRPEMYIGQIAMGRMNELLKRLAPPVASCGVFPDIADQARCDALARFQSAVARGRDTWSVGVCKELPDLVEQRDCAVVAHYWTRILVRLPAIRAEKATVMGECAKIPPDFTTLHDVCASMAASPMDYNETHKVLTDELASVAQTNLLLTSKANAWHDATATWKAGYGGWTWNAKFGDVDNDGWQDLFIAQGTRLRFLNTSNVLYHNKGGQKLEETTRAAGLQDHTPTGAFLYLDYDLDGDLDLITYPFQLTPVLWRNDGAVGPGLEVALDDHRTRNRSGVGARVEIAAPDGRSQFREIKASGGYQSHDLPVARFGLGDWAAVASIAVRWPDGEQAQFIGNALKPGRYRLVRREQ